MSKNAMGIIIGARYKLLKHPHQPIGTAARFMPQTHEIWVEWDDQTLNPPADHYPESYFGDGTFEFVDYGSDKPYYIREMEKEKATKTCSHEWAVYNGFREYYEYCKKCDIKKA
jgi:hypothetical protein